MSKFEDSEEINNFSDEEYEEYLYTLFW